MCVAEAGGTAANKLGQSLADVASALSSGLADYDALHLSEFAFAPATPLFECE
jgi:hypothetical protein